MNTDTTTRNAALEMMAWFGVMLAVALWMVYRSGFDDEWYIWAFRCLVFYGCFIMTREKARRYHKLRRQ